MKANTDAVRSEVTAAEWEQRVNLAACYRLAALYHWDDLIFTHISARVPGKEHHFLLNPYGMLFDEITASSLVKVDLAGNKEMDSPYHINPASAQKNGVLPISQQSTLVLPSLAYHDYEGIALNEDEKPRLVRDLGNNNFLMLRNHGLLTGADSIPDAFLFMYLFEVTCTIQIRAQAGGGELIQVNPKIIAGARALSKRVTRSEGGALAWPGLLRKLDRLDPSYRS